MKISACLCCGCESSHTKYALSIGVPCALSSLIVMMTVYIADVSEGNDTNMSILSPRRRVTKTGRRLMVATLKLSGVCGEHKQRKVGGNFGGI
jgi:hypothetical protein